MQDTATSEIERANDAVLSARTERDTAILQLEQWHTGEVENLPPSNGFSDNLSVLKLNLQKIAGLEAEVQRLKKVCLLLVSMSKGSISSFSHASTSSDAQAYVGATWSFISSSLSGIKDMYILIIQYSPISRYRSVST